MYQVLVHDPVNNLTWELPYLSWSYTEELNKGQDARFSFSAEGLTAIADKCQTTYLNILAGGWREIWLSYQGQKIYSGVITDLDEASDRETEQVSLSVATVGFFNILDKRRTGPKRVFAATDAGSIAWTLIAESQASDQHYSDLGLTQGTIAPSVNRDRTFRFDNIKEALTKLSNAELSNGFDFEIDNQKRLQIYYPQKGRLRPEIVLDEQNILNWARNRPSVLSLTNKVYVIGEGINDDVLYSLRTSSPAYRQVFGTLEDVLSEKDIIESTTLEAKGDRFLLDNQSPLETLTLSHVADNPGLTSYGLGDWLRLDIPKLGLANQYKRLIKRTVAADADELAIATLTLR